ncbi:hypothetical protein NC653_004023 [Populus alba x Populus x berolinensis]|uniref:Uncharacterized protein n=1 Tax=Populus alba x Populus x berolinensis TaxID=444605 RepID=A0AAD6WJ17_9ROSI|nr:hypothetical protein NC653_004023 [Populus alba x Populus x berolinensis]
MGEERENRHVTVRTSFSNPSVILSVLLTVNRSHQPYESAISNPSEYEEEEEEEEEYGNNEGYRGDDLYIEKAGVGPVVNVLKRGERLFYFPQGHKKTSKDWILNIFLFSE